MLRSFNSWPRGVCEKKIDVTSSPSAGAPVYMSAINFSTVINRSDLVGLSSSRAPHNKTECCTTMSFLPVTVRLIMVLLVSAMTCAHAHRLFLHPLRIFTVTFTDAVDTLQCSLSFVESETFPRVLLCFVLHKIMIRCLKELYTFRNWHLF